MPVYRAPVDDYRFVIQELLEFEKQRDLPQFGDLSPDTGRRHPDQRGKILRRGAAAAQPVRRRRRLPFRERRRAHAQGFQGSLTSLSPKRAGAAWRARPNMAARTCLSLHHHGRRRDGACPPTSLSRCIRASPAAAYCALMRRGAPWMKEHIVPKMGRGEWTGTMCLTEPGCGTDLRLMKTRAVEQPDGTYA